MNTKHMTTTGLIRGMILAYILSAPLLGHANAPALVNIEAPNSDGISYNRYEDFSVDRRGLVLNNSLEEVNSFLLQDQIAANPKLEGKTAQVIVNEVVGGNRTALYGAIEVVGDRANVIIANPNGLDIHRMYFLNVDHVSLWAGSIREIDLRRRTAAVFVDNGDLKMDSGFEIAHPA